MKTPRQPYKGLQPYEETDRDNFFGRDAEARILVDKILTNKLTLLFAASGVGKSSLLQAAVMPALRARGKIDLVYHRDWVGDPGFNLKRTIAKMYGQPFPERPGEAAAALPDFVHANLLFGQNSLVVILDQFEEFFNYQRHTPYLQRFVRELADAVQDRDTPTVFVISMREDFALELNAFKAHLSSTFLFENLYRLEKLTLEAATRAVAEPLKQVGLGPVGGIHQRPQPTRSERPGWRAFPGRRAALFGFTLEEGLLEEFISDLSQREASDLDGARFLEGALRYVEPPHLQIVCTQLWEAFSNRASTLALPDGCRISKYGIKFARMKSGKAFIQYLL